MGGRFSSRARLTAACGLLLACGPAAHGGDATAGDGDDTTDSDMTDASDGEGGCDPEAAAAGPYAVKLERPGFVVDGLAACERPALLGAADINGDGLRDLVLRSELGRLYVFLGRAASGRFFLKNLVDGVGGLVIEPGAQAPTSWTLGADVNGDGRRDLIASTDAGQTLVVYGTYDSAALDLDEVAAGVGGVAIDHGASGAAQVFAGFADVNADGFDDLLFAGARALQVLYGGPDLEAPSLDMVDLGIGGFYEPLENAWGDTRFVAAPVGDVDGDGYPEIAVVSSPAVPGSAGEGGTPRTEIVRGRAAGEWPASYGTFALFVDEVDDDGVEGVQGGDVDGDGLVDVVLSGSGGGGTDLSVAAQALAVLYGAAIEGDVAPLDRRSHVAPSDFEFDGPFAAAAVRDFDGDGRDDLLVLDADAAYLVFGPPPASFGEDSQYGLDLQLSPGLDPAVAVHLPFAAPAGLADVSGDGIAELAFAEPEADGDAPGSGRLLWIPGRTAWTGAEAPALVAAGEHPGDRFAARVVAADVNGDDVGDLVINAPRADPQGPDSGRLYVLFGPL